MTINKGIINEIEELLREEETVYNKSDAEKDEKTKNESFQRFRAMMKIVRLFGYDLNYDSSENLILEKNP